jgi:hypothetical protein
LKDEDKMEYIDIPANQIKPAWMRLREQYEAQGQPYHVVTRPYHSTGAFEFLPVGAPIVVTAQLPRQLMVARRGQAIDFFSYAVGDAVDGVGLGPRVANEADTNIVEKRETNDEDFAVAGLSTNVRGVRIAQTLDTEGAALQATFVGNDLAAFNAALVTGDAHIVDPSSLVVPPEVSSPLTLEDVLYQAIAKRTYLKQTWNKKQGDDLPLLRNIPNGGGESYLKSNGEPSISNIFHLSAGYAWKREGSGKDTKWGVRAELVEDTYVLVSLPEALVDFAGGEAFSALITHIWVDWQIHAHGNAFYYPSSNV